VGIPGDINWENMFQYNNHQTVGLYKHLWYLSSGFSMDSWELRYELEMSINYMDFSKNWHENIQIYIHVLESQNLLGWGTLDTLEILFGTC
jgi:hypothetical protein